MIVSYSPTSVTYLVTRRYKAGRKFHITTVATVTVVLLNCAEHFERFLVQQAED